MLVRTDSQRCLNPHRAAGFIGIFSIAGSVVCAQCLDILTLNEVYFGTCPPGGAQCYGACNPSFNDIVAGSTWQSVASTGSVLSVCLKGTARVVHNPPPPCYCSFRDSPVTHVGAVIVGITPCGQTP